MSIGLGSRRPVWEGDHYYSYHSLPPEKEAPLRSSRRRGGGSFRHGVLKAARGRPAVTRASPQGRLASLAGVAPVGTIDYGQPAGAAATRGHTNL
ncbi:hypothetical protein GW17_00052647 [Ensete ventricosum]|nr:hypothetical protein GW17_00052647 [Ensete ventricosum]